MQIINFNNVISKNIDKEINDLQKEIYNCQLEIRNLEEKQGILKDKINIYHKNIVTLQMKKLGCNCKYNYCCYDCGTHLCDNWNKHLWCDECCPCNEE